MKTSGTYSRLSSGERYDLAMDVWSPIASMSTTRYDHAAVAIGDFVYVVGGGACSGRCRLSSGER